MMNLPYGASAVVLCHWLCRQLALAVPRLALTSVSSRLCNMEALSPLSFFVHDPIGQEQRKMKNYIILKWLILLCKILTFRLHIKLSIFFLYL